jgi:hypothetical protein
VAVISSLPAQLSEAGLRRHDLAPRTDGWFDNAEINKYRGPGKVTVGTGHRELMVLKGGKHGQPFSAKGSTTVTFSEPGEYQVHVTANDLSGPGGGAAGCCWTTALITVTVKPAGTATPTGAR